LFQSNHPVLQPLTPHRRRQAWYICNSCCLYPRIEGLRHSSRACSRYQREQCAWKKCCVECIPAQSCQHTTPQRPASLLPCSSCAPLATCDRHPPLLVCYQSTLCAVGCIASEILSQRVSIHCWFRVTCTIYLCCIVSRSESKRTLQLAQLPATRTVKCMGLKSWSVCRVPGMRTS
jgi:hypothetical protein